MVVPIYRSLFGIMYNFLIYLHGVNEYDCFVNMVVLNQIFITKAKPITTT
jgi:hypothetical protein